MRRLLIANRGEIARRIIRTAHRLGIETVAVFSDADAGALHVQEATVAVALGGDTSADSYLRIDKLLAAARDTGADAVHPGYGFLSENADFAEAVIAAGLLWVGPPPAAMRALGSKSACKALALSKGVPCLPGYHGADQSDEGFAREAERITYPVMVKATAGGGGRGMRLVHDASQLPAALVSARSEAVSAFGSGDLLVEKALLNPRHVEVQVFADAHGHCIHLGERDCSVQRRHQKLIEETPSPAVDAVLRERMGACAIALARAAGYVGAGTVEFWLDSGSPSAPAGAAEPASPGRRRSASSGGSALHPAEGEVTSVGVFYLMEMNTRLQVEHAVTEAVTGLDLVEWQLRIAQGEPLPLTQEEVTFTGHAIEVRLCAEDENFVPHTGTVQHFREPGGLRFDHAIAAGLAVSPHYDSMLGKLVAHASTRAQAIHQLAAALDRTEVLGLPTNRQFLSACLCHPSFAAGDARIPFLVEEGGAIRAMLLKREQESHVLSGLAALFIAKNNENAFCQRLPCSFPRPVRLGHRDAVSTLQVREQPSDSGALQLEVTRGGEVSRMQLGRDGDDAFSLQTRGGLRQRLAVVRLPVSAGPATWHVQSGGVDLVVSDASYAPPADKAATGAAAQALRASFNGKVITVKVTPGQAVRRGDTLLVVESMKLEHALCAPRDAVVDEVLVAVGQQTAPGQVVLRFAAERQ